METNKDNVAVGPYFNTMMTEEIVLNPIQMDNKYYENLKKNLIRKFQNKCFKSYGYISKIYKITHIEGGQISPENSAAAAMYKVNFVCKLCRPIRGSLVVCEVKAINKTIAHLVNGPIHVLILFSGNQVNKSVFMYDEQENVMKARIGKDKNVKIVVGTHVNVRCIDFRIENGTQYFLVLGIMESVATKEEVYNSVVATESDDVQTMDFEKYEELDTEYAEERDEGGLEEEDAANE